MGAYGKLPEGVIVVTGATGRLGVSVVEILSEAGAGAVAIGCFGKTDQAEALRERALELGAGSAIAIKADLADDGELEAFAKAVEGLKTPVGGLVHLAGVNERTGLEDISREKLRRAMEVDVEGGILLASRLLPLMSEGSSIVFVGSAAARSPVTGIVPYAAAKAALKGAVSSLALELGKRGIRINLIEAGIIGRGRENDIGPMKNIMPIPRPGDESEFARTVLFLLSSASSYITGQRLPVTGGL